MPHFGEVPRDHRIDHELGGIAEINLTGLAGQTLWVPYNGKIADITHPDIIKHFLDLEVALGETRKIVAVIVSAERIAGTGIFSVYPNEGARGQEITGGHFTKVTVIMDGTQRLQYALSVANDDFDLYCLGYIVEI